MDFDYLVDNLVGFYSHDTTGSSWGIKDDRRKAEIIEYIKNMDEYQRRALMGKVVREAFLTDEALADGFGVEDVQAFITWMEDERVLF